LKIQILLANKLKSKTKAAAQAFVRQQDQSDCGPACLSAIISYYKGKELPLDHLRTLSGTTRQGSTLLGLYQAAQTLDLQPGAYEGTLASLRELDSPSILHVVKQERLLHFVVCYGHTDGGFIIGDPASGVSIISEPELDKIWQSKALLTFNPKETFSVNKIRNQTKRTLFWEIVREDRNILVLAFMLGIFVSGLNLSTAIFSQTLIDNILPAENRTKLFLGLLLLAIFLIVRNGLAYIRQQFLARQAKSFNNRVVGRFYSTLLRLPHNFFQSRKVGDLVARMNDTQRLQSVVTYVLGDVMIDALVLVTASGFLLYHNFSVGLLALLSVPFYAALSFHFHKPILIGQREFMSAHALNEGNYVDTIQGIDTIKVNNREEFFTNLTKQVYGHFQDKTYALSKVGIRFNLIAQILGTILIVAILAWSSILVLDERLKLGVLVAVIQMANLIIPAAWRIGLTNIQLQEARVAFERMYEFTSLTPEYEEKSSSVQKSEQTALGAITRLDIMNLAFRFTGQPLLFENVSLTMNRGEIVILLGDSGCGKTTLLYLLQRFCSPENGQIIVDQKNKMGKHPHAGMEKTPRCGSSKH
jgi:ATP-binding cassette subfamily B protein